MSKYLKVTQRCECCKAAGEHHVYWVEGMADTPLCEACALVCFGTPEEMEGFRCMESDDKEEAHD